MGDLGGGVLTLDRQYERGKVINFWKDYLLYNFSDFNMKYNVDTEYPLDGLNKKVKITDFCTTEKR